MIRNAALQPLSEELLEQVHGGTGKPGGRNEEQEFKLQEAADKIQEAQDKHGSSSTFDQIKLAFEYMGAAIATCQAAIQIASTHQQMPPGGLMSLPGIAQVMEGVWGQMQPLLEHPQVQEMMQQDPHGFLQTFADAMEDGQLNQQEFQQIFQAMLVSTGGQMPAGFGAGGVGGSTGPGTGSGTGETASGKQRG